MDVLPKIPRVFVSYSWDTDDHKTWVRYLAENLRVAGIDARLDQWYVKPGESFTHFMEDEVRSADHVLIVCTQSYAEKSNSRRGGVGYEQQIISGELVTGSPRSKFIPIVRHGEIDTGPNGAIPIHFLGIHAIDFRADQAFRSAFDELLRVLFSSPKYVPPPLGDPPELAPVNELPVVDTGQWSVYDVEMLTFFYPCFDRAAFQYPFLAEVPNEMIEAIDDTISALATGIRKTRGGTLIAQGRPKCEFDNEFLRGQFDLISTHLHEAKRVYEIASATGQLDIRTGVAIAADKSIPIIIDRKRNAALRLVNHVYDNLGRRPFPLIPEDDDGKYHLLDKVRSEFWKEEDETFAFKVQQKAEEAGHSALARALRQVSAGAVKLMSRLGPNRVRLVENNDTFPETYYLPTEEKEHMLHELVQYRLLETTEGFEEFQSAFSTLPLQRDESLGQEFFRIYRAKRPLTSSEKKVVSREVIQLSPLGKTALEHMLAVDPFLDFSWKVDEHNVYGQLFR
jgi:hypothetical protein